MKMTFPKFAAIAALSIAGVAGAGRVVNLYAQQPKKTPVAGFPVNIQQGTAIGYQAPSYPPGIPTAGFPIGPIQGMSEETRQAIAKLQSTNSSESDKAEAKETIRQYLKEIFDKDQKSRRDHVARLEEQIQRLKQQLDKRQDARSKLIELRLQLLENEGEGLGFPDSWRDMQSFTPPIPVNPRYYYPNNSMQPATNVPYYPVPQAANLIPSQNVGPEPQSTYAAPQPGFPPGYSEGPIENGRRPLIPNYDGPLSPPDEQPASELQIGQPPGKDPSTGRTNRKPSREREQPE
ncbi:MAG: hypothetical protein ABL921_09615 [Pirellula sp.]